MLRMIVLSAVATALWGCVSAGQPAVALPSGLCRTSAGELLDTLFLERNETATIDTSLDIGLPQDYGGSRTWFLDHDRVMRSGLEYVKFGIPRQYVAREYAEAGAEAIIRAGSHDGVARFIDPGLAAVDTPFFFLLSSKPCIFQLYHDFAQLRPQRR